MRNDPIIKKHNQRVNLTAKSFAPIVAKLSPSSYPYRWAPPISQLPLESATTWIFMKRLYFPT